MAVALTTLSPIRLAQRPITVASARILRSLAASSPGLLTFEAPPMADRIQDAGAGTDATGSKEVYQM